MVTAITVVITSYRIRIISQHDIQKYTVDLLIFNLYTGFKIMYPYLNYFFTKSNAGWKIKQSQTLFVWSVVTITIAITEDAVKTDFQIETTEDPCVLTVSMSLARSSATKSLYAWQKRYAA